MKTRTMHHISVSDAGEGALIAYIGDEATPVARTEQIIEATLLADYDEDGELVGIEVLAPVRLADVVALVTPEEREPLAVFLRQSAPRELLVA